MYLPIQLWTKFIQLTIIFRTLTTQRPAYIIIICVAQETEYCINNSTLPYHAKMRGGCFFFPLAARIIPKPTTSATFRALAPQTRQNNFSRAS